MNLISQEKCRALGIQKSVLENVLPQVNRYLNFLSPSECWKKISREILTPDHPFQLHSLIHETIFSNQDPKLGPPPTWIPHEEQVQSSNITALMKTLNLDSYSDFYAWSIKNRANFWDCIIHQLKICFHSPYTQVIDLSKGVESPQWLTGATLNIADSCFNGPEEHLAIISQQEGGPLSALSIQALNKLSNRVANALGEASFQPRDAIAINLPMTTEAVAIYLGIVKFGAVVISIADSFAAPEIETRLNLAKAKGVFTQDSLLRSGKRLPLYTKIIDANAPKAIVLSSDPSNQQPTKLRDGDLTWEEFLSDSDQFKSMSCLPSDHTNILFSSGTTGEPKGIPWTQTTPIKCASDGFLYQNIQSGDVVAWPTNLGWMMGPWLIYSSLINRATIALYNGSPITRAFGKFIEAARVTMLGVVPSLVRSWRETECMAGLDWSTIKTFSSTGESSNPEDMFFLMSLAGYRPVIEYCGGTEIGGGYITGTILQPSAPASFSTPALGLDFAILNEEGHPTNNGELFLIPPSIGLSTELLNGDHHQVYFENVPSLPGRSQLRRHEDQIECLGGGYYRAHGRVDDTMNIAGIKVSSIEIEQVINAMPKIRETAAIGISPMEGGPNLLVIYTVIFPKTKISKKTLMKLMQTAIVQGLNPLFKIHDIIIVNSLPKTASNKIIRRVLRNQYQIRNPTKRDEGKEDFENA